MKGSDAQDISLKMEEKKNVRNKPLLSEKDKAKNQVIRRNENGLQGKNRNSGTQAETDDVDRLILPPNLIRKQKRQIWFNVICLIVSNSLVSCGRMSLMNSITSLILDHELAITVLMLSSFVQYAGAMILLTPAIKLLSLKLMSILAQVFSLLFIASFFLPNWPILLSGAVSVGLAFSLTMSCIFAYGNVLGYWYHKVCGGNLSLILVLMSSLVNGAVTGGFLWGNLILFFILDLGSSTSYNSNETNICGISYCNENLRNFTSMAPPPVWKYNTLITVFTAVAGVGVLLTLLLTNVSYDKFFSKKQDDETLSSKFKEIFSMAKEYRCLLLAFISLFIGFEQSFIIADYTKIYISCFLGVSRVGYIMIGYGIALVTMPCVHWLLIKVLGRTPVIAISYLLFMGGFLMLFLWPIEEYTAKIFFGLITIFGIADSLMFCVVASMFALFYKNNVESALALCNFWRSSGLVLSYTCNYFLCTKIKLSLLIALGTAALLSYFLLEFIIHRKYKNKKKQLQELELKMMNQNEQI